MPPQQPLRCLALLFLVWVGCTKSPGGSAHESVLDPDPAVETEEDTDGEHAGPETDEDTDEDTDSDTGKETVADSEWTFPICGAPNSEVPGYVPHGDPMANGTAQMRIDDGRLTISIDLGEQRYHAHHAHLYSTSSDYTNSDVGHSTVCWAYDNFTENDPLTAPYNEKSLAVEDWPATGSYSWQWYIGHLRQIDDAKGGDWYVMVHMLGGHFAVDEDGHLIEWDPAVHETQGAEHVAGNFEGNNAVRVDCNARHGRTLADRDLRTGNTCQMDLGAFNEVEAPFLDQNGLAWLDADGSLTPAALDHGYDLTTEYLFFSFADAGVTEQYGGPEGGAGGFINGQDGDRCADWPPAGWGDPHSH